MSRVLFRISLLMGMLLAVVYLPVVYNLASQKLELF